MARNPGIDHDVLGSGDVIEFDEVILDNNRQYAGKRKTSAVIDKLSKSSVFLKTRKSSGYQPRENGSSFRKVRETLKYRVVLRVESRTCDPYWSEEAADARQLREENLVWNAKAEMQEAFEIEMIGKREKAQAQINAIGEREIAKAYEDELGRALSGTEKEWSDFYDRLGRSVAAHPRRE